MEFHLVKDGVVKANVTSSKHCQRPLSHLWVFYFLVLFPSLSSICSFETQLEGDLIQEAILTPSQVP